MDSEEGDRSRDMEKMKEKEQGSNPRLPPQIMEEILSKLPVRSLLRFRCVSKQWRSLFSDPLFITKHLNRSTEKIQNPTHILVAHRRVLYTSEIESGTQQRDLQLLSTEHPFNYVFLAALSNSLDGLVCLLYGGQELCLYNPATRKYWKLPTEYDYCGFSHLGLGFDPLSKKYKVVKVSYFENSLTTFQIYTHGSDRWRRTDNSLRFSICNHCPNTSVYVSGAVHWVANPEESDAYYRRESILSFDFQQEVFQEVLSPWFGLLWRKPHLCLGVLGGCLSVSVELQYGSTEIWVMKEYGVEESWTKLCSIGSVGFDGHKYSHIFPLGFVKGGKILFQTDEYELILYNPESKRKWKLGFRGLPILQSDSFGYIFHYVGFLDSLVSLGVESGGTTNS